MWTISRSLYEVERSMKWVVELSWWLAEKRRLCGTPTAVTRQRGAGWRWGACQGASSSGPRSKRRLFIASGTLSGGGDWSPGGSSSSRRRLTLREDLEIAHIIFVQREPSRP
ncbi:unnamed protein product [Spirodela intermedia]|uniref:Uncharacterized protein n=1 Tax=Spirodela intermedia TaxID=51605 RepID=A0A7I8KJ65_SPIIN|nr:unnamed protein product [Spirodela intermedia]